MTMSFISNLATDYHLAILTQRTTSFQDQQEVWQRTQSEKMEEQRKQDEKRREEEKVEQRKRDDDMKKFQENMLKFQEDMLKFQEDMLRRLPPPPLDTDETTDFETV